MAQAPWRSVTAANHIFALVRTDRASRSLYLLLLIQGVLAAVFLLTGLFKFLGGPYGTIVHLHAINWLPVPANVTIARILPFLEILLACWLASGKWPRAATVAVLGLVIAFSIVLIILGRRIGWQTECGCFGPFNRSTLLQAIVRNLVIAGVCAAHLAVLRRHHRIARESPAMS